jgi:hypothetical protein
MAILTDHSIDRAKQRLNIKPKPFLKMAERALKEGICHNQTSGKLNSYLSSLYFYNKSANNLRIYGKFVYIFHSETLITVIHLPKVFFKQLGY